jgi:predicted nucleic acid-binding protein
MAAKDSFLFDTSSLLYILKTRKYNKLSKNCHLLDLTFYEYGNAALNILIKRNGKDLLASKEEEIKILLQAFEKIADQLTILTCQRNPVPLSDIFELAKKERITFYDASYLQYCLIHDLSFITEDEQLTTAANRNSVSVIDADKWIKLG